MNYSLKNKLDKLKAVFDTLEIDESELEQDKEKAILQEQIARGLMPRYYGATFENFIADTPYKKNIVSEIQKAWSKNILITGKYGTGKTHLAMCLLKSGATYRRLQDIFRDIKNDFNSEGKIIKRLSSAKLLVIDEIGRQKFSDFEKNILFEIIDGRYNNVLYTTLITNLSVQEFSNEYGTAVMDRLKPTVLDFNWESRR